MAPENWQAVAYNRDLEAITKPLRFFLLWPKNNRPEDVNAMFYSNMIVHYLPLSIPVMFGLIFHVWKDLQGFNWSMLTDILVIMQIICLFVMFLIYLYNVKTIVATFNKFIGFGENETFDYPKIISRFYVGVPFTVFILSSYKYITKSNCLRRKTLYTNSAEICGYIIPKEFPFDIYHFPIYELLFLYEFAVLSIAIGTTLNGLILMMYLVEKNYTKLKYIKSSVKSVNKLNLSDHESVRTALIGVAKAHNNVFNAIEALNDNCKYLNLIYLIMASMIQSICLLNVLIWFNIESLMPFLGWFVSIFMVTLGCQILTDEAATVATALYKINWYEMNPENKRLVLFMMMAAQHPLGVDAGPFKTLCLTTFLTMFKATYSYLNFLLHIAV